MTVCDTKQGCDIQLVQLTSASRIYVFLVDETDTGSNSSRANKDEPDRVIEGVVGETKLFRCNSWYGRPDPTVFEW